jgi:hypothetical protein
MPRRHTCIFFLCFSSFFVYLIYMCLISYTFYTVGFYTVKFYTGQILYGQNLYGRILYGQNLYSSKFIRFKIYTGQNSYRSKFIQFKIYTVQNLYGQFLYRSNFIQSPKHPLLSSMHFSENIFLLGGKWRPYGRHFALTAQKKSIKNIFSFEFFF